MIIFSHGPHGLKNQKECSHDAALLDEIANDRKVRYIATEFFPKERT